MVLLDSQIWPRARGVPGSASSLPVEMTATRGRGRAGTVACPAAASRPSSTGPILVPAVSSRSPGLTSPPVSRTAAPGSTGARNVTWPSAAAGQLHLDHRVGPGRQRRAGHDAEAAARLQPVLAGVAGRDLPGHRQRHRALRARPGQVRGQHGEPVHRRVVERRQRVRRGDVRGGRGALRVGQAQLPRRERRDRRADLGQVLIDALQVAGWRVRVHGARHRVPR